MDFASWRKCDFQIHTPRDPNWNGDRPVGVDEAVNENGAKATEPKLMQRADNGQMNSWINV